MRKVYRFLVPALLGVAVLAASVQADLTDSLKIGKPGVKSLGPIAFGPDGVLFVSDPQGSAIFAIDTGDRSNTQAAGTVKLAGIDRKIAGLLGTDAKDIIVNDLAVNPASGNLYFSVSRGKGPTAQPALVRLDRQGKLALVDLQRETKFARSELPNVNVAKGPDAITCLAYVKGQVIVAGLGNENWASTLRSVPFPFTAANKPTSVEIFHGAHGKFETNAPVRTFVPLDLKGETTILAAYTCTPLVRFPVSDLKPGSKVKGTTVAELGSGNRPLDMIAYQKGGKDYLLITNSKRGVMKVNLEGVDKAPAITQRPKAQPAGQPYETIKDLQNVVQLDRLDKDNAVILVRSAEGTLNLETVPLP